jgi:hypothetical protein
MISDIIVVNTGKVAIDTVDTHSTDMTMVNNSSYIGKKTDRQILHYLLHI